MLRFYVPLVIVGSLFNGYRFEPAGASAQEEANPFLEAAKSFLEEAMERNADNGQSGGMVATLSGILHSLKDSKQDLLSSSNAPLQNGGGNMASDILTGVAGMLSKNSQAFDPNIIGQVADVLSTLASDKNSAPPTNEVPDQSSGPDWSAILGLTSNLLSSASSDKVNNNNNAGEGGFGDLLKGGGLEGFMNLLPLLTSSAPSGHVHFADSDLEDQSEHKKYEQSNYLPPFMHVIYEYWDHFKKSEFGETIWRESGLEAIFQLFIDKDGYFQIDRIFESVENASFRRKWIKSLSSFVGELVEHISEPNTRARFVANVKYLADNFLKSRGYSNAVHFDPHGPTESVATILDAVFKRHFGLKIHSGKYVRPAIFYIQDLFKLDDGKNFLNVSHLSSEEISSKLSELLNGELIEPILRVWRAYKFSIKHPQCDKRLICHLNQKDGPYKTGLKPGVTKLSSLIASWYVSGKTGTPFWKLYNAATEDIACENHYPADCQSYFDEEWRIASQSGHGDEL